jgi:TetR/AcrR family transcriptional repressor of nem operon
MANVRNSAKTKLLDAAMHVIRAKGYSATTVDDICDEAGVTKGGFFHHFESKEDLGVGAAAHFGAMAEKLFATAPYQTSAKAVDRLFGYVDFRKELLRGGLAEFTCLLGTLVQEAYETHPPIREACDKHISAHAAMLEADIALALKETGVKASWSPSSLAFHIQAVIQGSLILAKAKYGPEIAADCLDHLRLYLETIFRPSNSSKATSKRKTGSAAA